jgi:hypothetical protein
MLPLMPLLTNLALALTKARSPGCGTVETEDFRRLLEQVQYRSDLLNRIDQCINNQQVKTKGTP